MSLGKNLLFITSFTLSLASPKTPLAQNWESERDFYAGFKSCSWSVPKSKNISRMPIIYVDKWLRQLVKKTNVYELLFWVEETWI